MNSLLEISTTALKTFLSSSCKLTRFSLTLQPSPRALSVKFINPDWPTNTGDFCVGKWTTKKEKINKVSNTLLSGLFCSLSHACREKSTVLCTAVIALFLIAPQKSYLLWSELKYCLKKALAICCPLFYYALLCCTLLCYVLVCCALLCYVVLSYAMLCHVVLCCLFCVNYIALCCSMLFYFALCCAMLSLLCYVALCWT